MGSPAERLLWAWMVSATGSPSASLPEIGDGGFIDECVGAHNGARSSVRPPASLMLYMTWDEGLAVAARAWASRCSVQHNPHLNESRRMHPVFASVGENVWVGTPPSAFDTRGAITSWVSEQEHYDYWSNNCSDMCGHYTQVVWWNTYKVGCAAQLCPDGIANFAPTEGVVFVCNYATAGNIFSVRPYQSQGRTCSGCQDSCVDNLCRNPKRDLQKSYSWTPDWASAPAPAATGLQYVRILCVRPLALALTLAAAHAVRHFYPDVFCYE